MVDYAFVMLMVPYFHHNTTDNNTKSIQRSSKQCNTLIRYGYMFCDVLLRLKLYCVPCEFWHICDALTGIARTVSHVAVACFVAVFTMVDEGATVNVQTLTYRLDGVANAVEHAYLVGMIRVQKQRRMQDDEQDVSGPTSRGRQPAPASHRSPGDSLPSAEARQAFYIGSPEHSRRARSLPPLRLPEPSRPLRQGGDDDDIDVFSPFWLSRISCTITNTTNLQLVSTAPMPEVCSNKLLVRRLCIKSA